MICFGRGRSGGSTIAPRWSASCLNDVTDLDEFEGLVDALAAPDPRSRQEAAARLATASGCEELQLFVLDSQTGTFVPAPGMPKIVRGGPSWRSFLVYCVKVGTHQANVDLPSPVSRLACAISTGTALAVAVGGNSEGARMRLFARRIPLLGALVLSQQARRDQDAEVVLAREGAARAHSLAVVLDAARSAARRAQQETGAEVPAQGRISGHARRRELRNTLAPLVNSVELARRGAQPGQPALGRPLDVMA